MTILKIISLASVATGVAASLVLQQQSQAKLHEGAALIRQHEQQLAALAAERERLSLALVAPVNDNAVELARLSTEAGALQQETNELSRQMETNFRRRLSAPVSHPKTHPPQYYEQFRKLVGNKGGEARDLASAFREYAGDHQMQSPTSLDQLAPYLAKNNRKLSGSNQFEIIYQGSLDNLQGIPTGAVAVIREQQPWPGPDGGMLRAYGLADGVGQIVGSEDNFKTWEAQHVIAPSP